MKKIFCLIFAFGISVSALAQESDLQIPAEVARFVEAGTKALRLEKADLNGDGFEDYLLVLEKQNVSAEDPMEAGQRPLLILTGDKTGKLTLAKRNDEIIMCRQCGGIFGDPFEDLIAKPKSFTAHMYGGSAWRWSYTYTFNYSRIDNTWQLVRVEESSYHTSDPDKAKTKIYTPKTFGKIDIADFNPESYSRKSGK